MIHHLLRAAILTGFALFIVYLFKTGEMTLYIAPRMEPYVKLSAIGLYAAAIYQVYAALQKRMGKHEADCNCEHDHEPSPSIAKNTLIYGLFILPLALGFLAPTGTLGSALAAKKGVSLSGSPSFERKPEVSPAPISEEKTLDALFPADEYTIDHAQYGKILYSLPTIEVPEKQFIETLTTLDLYREAFVGKEVVLSGFVYREDEMGKERFAVSRFAMNCCSADALPYGLMIEWPKANEYGSDEWVSVKGTLKTTSYMDNEIITLEATKIERIEAPESPYVYPDLEFAY
ncbi:TIGR03943 family putative permease subunit [Paenibacillus harenae]|uniref:Repeat protein (TIGR03943 family) n=1 Tax=Paenibacillus harenae TaxID=306543 RepID=A0ABT9U6N4_PAEHA|nr:TIGR03943 family protein [Paenibacillus harenae]MDQ0115305.1 putative repeat protein (TIGR03943 family) [Paenibacillus harenae]